jgi:hypothetical protein
MRRVIRPVPLNRRLVLERDLYRGQIPLALRTRDQCGSRRLPPKQHRQLLHSRLQPKKRPMRLYQPSNRRLRAERQHRPISLQSGGRLVQVKHQHRPISLQSGGRLVQVKHRYRPISLQLGGRPVPNEISTPTDLPPARRPPTPNGAPTATRIRYVPSV